MIDVKNTVALYNILGKSQGIWNVDDEYDIKDNNE